MTFHHRSLIALGANLGDPSATLARVIECLADQGSMLRICGCSSFHGTRPVGGPSGQSAYANAVVEVATDLSPAGLHTLLRDIEARFGRVAGPTWSARNLDLDILSFDSSSVRTPELVIPHPRMTVRRFVLDPLMEIAPDWIHPQLGWSVRQIVAHLDRSRPVVSLGADYDTLFARIESIRGTVSESNAAMVSWTFVRSQADAMFEYRPIVDRQESERWRLPRFHPTSDQAEVAVDQLLATCVGLRPGD